MSDTIWTEVTITANETESLTFRRSEQPGALVAVTLNGQTVQVRPAALLAAAKLMQLETEE